MAVIKCVAKFSGDVLKVLAASIPKCGTRDDPWPPIPAGIQDEIRLKNRLRMQRQITRVPALKAEINRLQRSFICGLNEWINHQWSATLESLDPEDQTLWRMTKRVKKFLTLSPSCSPQGKSLCKTLRKPKSLQTIWRRIFSR